MGNDSRSASVHAAELLPLAIFHIIHLALFSQGVYFLITPKNINFVPDRMGAKPEAITVHGLQLCCLVGAMVIEKSGKSRIFEFLASSSCKHVAFSGFNGTTETCQPHLHGDPIMYSLYCQLVPNGKSYYGWIVLIPKNKSSVFTLFRLVFNGLAFLILDMQRL